jgi:outer membrane immunogenic protein
LGGQIGYNFQFSPNFVAGAEADLGWVSAHQSKIVNNGAYTWNQKSGVDALGTARLRLGYTFDRAMLYVTGGLAYAKVRDSFQQGGYGFGYSWSNGSGKWKAGWTLGAGLEYALNNTWSIKAEGLYYDLGKSSGISSVTTGGSTYNWGFTSRNTGVLARVGLNYRFGGPAAPAVAKY